MIDMKKNYIYFLLILFSPIVSSSSLIDIIEIAGKSQVQVSKIIGQPLNCSLSKYGKKCSYNIAETEIVFINGKADWITVEGIDYMPFNFKALKSIGLEPKKPSFKSNFILRWSNIQGLKEVSIFKGGSNSDYAYIKAYTK